jgi:hypothetical protein
MAKHRVDTMSFAIRRLDIQGRVRLTVALAGIRQVTIAVSDDS